jgi:hypothetical protein
LSREFARDNIDALREDINLLLSDVALLKEQLGQTRSQLLNLLEPEAPPGLEDNEVKAEANIALNRLRGQAERLEQELTVLGEEVTTRTDTERFAYSVFIVTSTGVLDTEARWLGNILTRTSQGIGPRGGTVSGSLQTGAREALTWVQQTFLPLIQKILAQLWQVIAGLVRPKEWKVLGSVGSPLLGLGNVQVELTFGP